jgi:hypothetical protein
MDVDVVDAILTALATHSGNPHVTAAALRTLAALCDCPDALAVIDAEGRYNAAVDGGVARAVEAFMSLAGNESVAEAGLLFLDTAVTQYASVDRLASFGLLPTVLSCLAQFGDNVPLQVCWNVCFAWLSRVRGSGGTHC